MKTICKILVFDNRVSKDCFSELIKTHPSGSKKSYFELLVPEGHPMIPKIIKVLQKHGLKIPPNYHFSGEEGFISIGYHREFEASDFATAQYIEIRVSSTYLALPRFGGQALGDCVS